MKIKTMAMLAFTFLGLSMAATRADVTEHQESVHQKGKLITYRMTVTPAAQPMPAFKYRLTVLPHQTVAGNAAMHYTSSFAERGLDGPEKEATKKFGFDLYAWSYPAVADAEVPIEKLREVCTLFNVYIENYIRRATFCRQCDWGIAEEDLTGLESLEFPLSGIQQSRAISRILALRTRLAVLEGRYDDAIDQLRMNYQLGQNVGQIKFMVGSLIGIGAVDIANQGMLHLITAKDSPNMYWALAELPSPVINVRAAGRLECHWGLQIFPELENIEIANHSDDEWTQILNSVNEKLNRLDQLVRRIDGDPGDLLNQWSFAALALNSYPTAKQRLVAQGWSPKKIEAMPVAQVLLIDMKLEYLRYANEAEKSFYVPIEEAKKFSRKAESDMPRSVGELSFGSVLTQLILPATTQVQQTQLRVESHRRAMQVVEALRMHLAENGRFPTKLSEVTVVPVPLNPATGEPFAYWLDGDKGVVDLPFSDGLTGPAYRYELEAAK